MSALRVVLIALALWVIGGLLAAFWNGYGAYVMVVLDLAGLVWLVVGLLIVSVRKRHIRQVAVTAD